EGVKTVRYARDEAGVAAAFAAARAASLEDVLAQEYVAGEGYGWSALYWNGALQRSFMHRRVREWPPSGGTSACAESVLDAPALARPGAAPLDALRAHGVASAWSGRARVLGRGASSGRRYDRVDLRPAHACSTLGRLADRAALAGRGRGGAGDRREGGRRSRHMEGLRRSPGVRAGGGPQA